jgi:hypothetical protein
MSTKSYPELTPQQKERLQTAYKRTYEADVACRDEVNRAVAAKRRTEKELHACAVRMAKIYQGELPFEDESPEGGNPHT